MLSLTVREKIHMKNLATTCMCVSNPTPTLTPPPVRVKESHYMEAKYSYLRSGCP